MSEPNIIIKKRNHSAVGNMLNRYEKAVKNLINDESTGSKSPRQRKALVEDYQNSRNRIRDRLLEPYAAEIPHDQHEEENPDEILRRNRTTANA